MKSLTLAEPGLEVALTATLTWIDVGPGIELLFINADADVYVVHSNFLDDASAVPTGTRFRIPAGVSHPVRPPRARGRLLLAAVTGTCNAWVLGQVGWAAEGATADPCG
jgi:hypothetical protein